MTEEYQKDKNSLEGTAPTGYDRLTVLLEAGIVLLSAAVYIKNRLSDPSD